MNGIKIAGLGMALPERCVTNDDMAKIVETSDEWIRTRTGVETRYFIDGSFPLNAIDKADGKDISGAENHDHHSLTDLAIEASKRAMDDAGVSPEEIGLIIYTTFASERVLPSEACMVQKYTGVPAGAIAFDLYAACTGFIYGMTVADSLMGKLPEDRPYGLVIGADAFSRHINFYDRSSCILFGDGVGAAVVKASADNYFDSHLAAEGDDESIYCLGPDSRVIVEGTKMHDPDPAEEKIYMNGRAVFRFAVSKLEKEVLDITAKNGITLDDVDYVVCHQANKRIIDHVQEKLELPSEKFYVNLQKVGNLGAASIPLALAQMKSEGLLKEGMKIVCVGFGAGFTWGSCLITM